MKKIICIILCFCTLFSFVSCNQDEYKDEECYISSASVIFGNRIYRNATAQQITGSDSENYLVYSNIGEERSDIHIGCIDPLCTHEWETCAAFMYSLSEILFVPSKKAPKIYFFSEIPETDLNGKHKSVMALIGLNMKTGERKIICELSEDFQFWSMFRSFLFSDGYIYWIGHLLDGSVEGTTNDNIWRVWAGGGEAEQVTRLQAQSGNGYYTLYYRDADGYFYYYVYHASDKKYLARSKDFMNEKILLDDSVRPETHSSLDTLNIHIDDGMIYYFMCEKAVHGKEERPFSGKYDIYEDEEYFYIPCSIYRIPTDGSAEPECIAEDVYQKNISQNIVISEGKLYYIPLHMKPIGTISYEIPRYFTGKPEEDMKKGARKVLQYIRSYNSGKIKEIDLETLEMKTYTIGEQIETLALYGIFEDKLLIGTKTTDIDTILKITGDKFYNGQYDATSTGQTDIYYEYKVIDLD